MLTPQTLSKHFVSAAHCTLNEDPTVLESLLQGLWSAGSEAWPDVHLSPEVFARHLGRQMPAGSEPLQALPTLYIEDLYLACACAQHNPAALRALDRGYLAGLGGFDSAQTDELQQVLRERLLVGAQGIPPRISEYAGRGSLLSYLRTVAMRAFTDMRRKREEALLDGQEDGALCALAAAQDPELDYIKGRYRQAFQMAFVEALQTLSIQQRNVLRLRYVDGVNLEAVGAVLGVSRATAHRWLLEARAMLVQDTQRLLRERLHLSVPECASLVRLIHSQIDFSIGKALREPAGSGDNLQGLER